jgi:hypothetical protein
VLWIKSNSGEGVAVCFFPPQLSPLGVAEIVIDDLRTPRDRFNDVCTARDGHFSPLRIIRTI